MFFRGSTSMLFAKEVRVAILRLASIYSLQSLYLNALEP